MEYEDERGIVSHSPKEFGEKRFITASPPFPPVCVCVSKITHDRNINVGNSLNEFSRNVVAGRISNGENLYDCISRWWWWSRKWTLNSIFHSWMSKACFVSSLSVRWIQIVRCDPRRCLYIEREWIASTLYFNPFTTLPIQRHEECVCYFNSSLPFYLILHFSSSFKSILTLSTTISPLVHSVVLSTRPNRQSVSAAVFNHQTPFSFSFSYPCHSILFISLF